jgi:hypothetical protein
VATDAAGNVKRSFPASPDGNMNIDDHFDSADVNACMNKVAANGPKVAPGAGVLTQQELAHGDIAPLSNGYPNPDGYIDIVDCLLIARKLNGYSVLY